MLIAKRYPLHFHDRFKKVVFDEFQGEGDELAGGYEREADVKADDAANVSKQGTLLQKGRKHLYLICSTYQIFKNNFVHGCYCSFYF